MCGVEFVILKIKVGVCLLCVVYVCVMVSVCDDVYGVMM